MSSLENLKNLLLTSKQTAQLCASCVTLDGLSLEFIRFQTNNLCLTAVKQNANALRFVRDQTNYIVNTALEIDGLSLQHVRAISYEHCLTAIEQNIAALRYVPPLHKNDDLLKYAISIDYKALQYINNPSIDIRLYAVSKSGLNIKYIRYLTPKIIRTAIRNNPRCIKYLNEKDIPKGILNYILNILHL